MSDRNGSESDRTDTYVVIDGERYGVSDISVDTLDTDEVTPTTERIAGGRKEFEATMEISLEEESARKLSRILGAPVFVDTDQGDDGDE